MQEPDQRALPGVPPDGGGLGHLLHHTANASHLDGYRPVVRREPALQGPPYGANWGLHPLFKHARRPQPRQVGLILIRC